MSEMLEGRVKTLHPAIHAGTLARDRHEDIEQLNEHGYAPINMVVCNLYPFQETVAHQKGITLQDAIEQIDIDGVTLLRAAAKNFFHVIVLSDANDYAKVSAELKASGEVDLSTRLAVKSFAHTRDYDTAIHNFLSTDSAPILSDETLPKHLSFGLQQAETLRYGENPHQPAAYYSRTNGNGPLGGEFIGGQKQLSFNNYLDMNAAWRAVSTSFDDPTVIIVNHLTPIGIASAETITDAYPRALAADPVSAYGSVVGVNREVDVTFVEALGSVFTEAIAAPSFTPEAQSLLAEKRKNCRLVRLPHPFDGAEYEVCTVQGRMLVQQADLGDLEGTELKVVTDRKPTAEEFEAMQYAWKAVQHVKSDAIVIAQHEAVVGVGGGLPSRVDAARLAITKAGENAKGAVLASDALIPFADGLEVSIEAGITAVIQPGGSIRDAEVVEAANKANVAMVFTGTRHFRH
jgi:phosphoribosylaminoimidazolecarboxamide formyltransferase/IMP cyclohydrolase